MSTTTKTNRKTYDPEFKKQAVQLLLSSGRPLAQIVRELGVLSWQLRDWKQRLQPQLAQQPETLEAMRRNSSRWPISTAAPSRRSLGATAHSK
ncbi:MAG: transposase [Verrucomicrobia bacterium]|nr:transposase [Verrucomicrobiota bacterium]